MTVTSSLSAVEQAIIAQAEANGVDPRLALATAQNESGLNPTAVGDGGTSFGLYQLHQGGELGNLTPAQAYVPTTNAAVALSVLGQVVKANPNIGDPGTLAAMAQRPANPGAYASSVDAIYNDPQYFPQVPAHATSAQLDSVNWGSVGGSVGSALGGAVAGPVGSAVAGTLGGGVASILSGGGIESAVFKIVLEGVFVGAALALIMMGLSRLFPGAVSTIKTAVPLA